MTPPHCSLGQVYCTLCDLSKNNVYCQSTCVKSQITQAQARLQNMPLFVTEFSFFDPTTFFKIKFVRWEKDDFGFNKTRSAFFLFGTKRKNL